MDKEIRLMYLQIMCDLLNECKLHNFEITNEQLEKIASKKVLTKLELQGTLKSQWHKES
jgi:hypothetical protein